MTRGIKHLGMALRAYNCTCVIALDKGLNDGLRLDYQVLVVYPLMRRNLLKWCVLITDVATSHNSVSLS